MDDEGAGFISEAVNKVRKFFSPCLCYGKGTSKTLKQYGFYPIESMQIYRTPLNNALGIAMNVISLGQWFSLMKEFGFDRFYHLALVVTVRTPKGFKNIIIEKNVTINVSTSYNTNKNTEIFPINLASIEGGVSHLLVKTRQVAGDDAFFLYDAFKNNCQYFIKYILQSNELYSKGAEEFLFQDISELVLKLPSIVKKSVRGITDTSATFKKIIGAGSKPKDPVLYNKAKEIADRIYSKPSAYKSGFIVKTYKSMGGEYEDSPDGNRPLERWFKEEWKDIGNKEYPVYRPTKRITKDTPLTVDEIDPDNLKTQIAVKQKIKGSENLPAFKKKGSGKLSEVRDIAKQKGIYGVINYSKNKDKKYSIETPYGIVNFGQKGYEDFLDHRDLERKKAFHNRFKSNKGYNDPRSGLYYSQKLLW